jgi:hypothetical protein
LVLGIGIMLFGIVLTLDRLGYLQATSLLRFWPIMLILLGTSVMVQAFFGVSTTGPGQRGRPAIGFPLLLLLVVVGVLAMRDRGEVARANNGERVTLYAVMGGNRHTSLASPFRGADMTSVMGESRLDLRQATLPPGEEAVVDVHTLMGAAVIYVPEGWIVDVQTLPVMGGVKDERWRTPRSRTDRAEEAAGPGREGATTDAGSTQPPGRPGADAKTTAAAPLAVETDTAAAPPRLVVRGLIMMGGLIIRS